MVSYPLIFPRSIKPGGCAMVKLRHSRNAAAMINLFCSKQINLNWPYSNIDDLFDTNIFIKPDIAGAESLAE